MGDLGSWTKDGIKLLAYAARMKPGVGNGPAQVTSLKWFSTRALGYALAADLLDIFRNDLREVRRTLREFRDSLREESETNQRLREALEYAGPFLPGLAPDSIFDPHAPYGWASHEGRLGLTQVKLTVPAVITNRVLPELQIKVNEAGPSPLHVLRLNLPRGWELHYLLELPPREAGMLPIERGKSAVFPCTVTLELEDVHEGANQSEHIFEALRAYRSLYLYLRDDGELSIPITAEILGGKPLHRTLKVRVGAAIAEAATVGSPMRGFVNVGVNELEERWNILYPAVIRFVARKILQRPEPPAHFLPQHP